MIKTFTVTQFKYALSRMIDRGCSDGDANIPPPHFVDQLKI